MSIVLRLLLGNLMGLLLLAAAPSHAQDIPTFTLTMRAGRFVPETIEVPANVKFRLELKNEGPGAEEFESIELREEKVLAPGASSALIFLGVASLKRRSSLYAGNARHV